MTKKVLCALLILFIGINMECFAFSATEAVDMSESSSIAQTRDQSITCAAFSKDADGFAGIESGESVRVLTLSDTTNELPLKTSMSAGSYPRFEITHGLDFAANKKSTFQFNVYVEGDIVGGFTFHWSDVLVWNLDGTLQYKYYESDAKPVAMADAGTLERGRWHTIAITYDYETEEQTLYADGRFLATCKRAGGYNNSTVAKHTTMRVGAYGGSGAGRIAIDRVYAYKGAYDAAGDMLTISSSESLTVDEEAGSIVYDEEIFVDADSLKAQIISATGASKAVFFDSAMEVVTDGLPTDGICVLTAPSGACIYSFTIQPIFGIGEAKLTYDGDGASVKATAYNNRDTGKPLTMVVALRDTEGCIRRIYSSDVYDVCGKVELVADNIVTEDFEVYVFFIENWNSLKAVNSAAVKLN